MVLFFDGLEDFGFQLFEIVRDKVRQVIVFRVLPALLDRIQLRGVLRQPLEFEPVGMILFEVCRSGAMHRPAIPD
jgi:hypothetical protein